MFKINDFVFYRGRLSQYDKSTAQILRFENFNENPRIFLLSLIDKNQYWADYSEINIIEVTENHLLQLGFNKESTNLRSNFVFRNVIISKIAIYIDVDNLNFLFFSGFCVGDFKNPHLDVSKYIENGKFLFQKFYFDYPKINTINELFQFLKEIDFSFNSENVLLG